MVVSELNGKGCTVSVSCNSMDIPRSTWYRRRKKGSLVSMPRRRRCPPNKLSERERQAIVDTMHDGTAWS